MVDVGMSGLLWNFFDKSILMGDSLYGFACYLMR